MSAKIICSATSVGMEYKGGKINSNLKLVPFEEKYFEQCERMMQNGFFEMRKALNIHPFREKCNLEALKEKPPAYVYFTLLVNDNNEFVAWLKI